MIIDFIFLFISIFRHNLMSSQNNSQSLSTKNRQLKLQLESKTHQLNDLRKKLCLVCKNERIMIENEKKCSNLIEGHKEMLANLTKSLIQKQIAANNSVQFLKTIHIYESKIKQLRIQAYSKQMYLDQLQSREDILFPEDFFAPTINQMRKFFIQSFHRQKMEKLLKNLSSLKKQCKQNNFKNECSSFNEKCIFLGQKIQQRIQRKLIIKIKQEDKRNSQLSEKLIAYIQILKIMQKEKESMLNQLTCSQKKEISKR